ncbi:MAG: hypothetical protein V4710_13750 [Verrucomicrobiota bacterium]
MAAEEAAAAKSGPANKKRVLTVEKLLTFIPEGATIEQGQLKALIEKAGYPEKPTRAVIKDALAEGAIHRHEFKRFKAKPEIHFARHPQAKMVRPSAQNESEKNNGGGAT